MVSNSGPNHHSVNVGITDTLFTGVYYCRWCSKNCVTTWPKCSDGKNLYKIPSISYLCTQQTAIYCKWSEITSCHTVKTLAVIIAGKFGKLQQFAKFFCQFLLFTWCNGLQFAKGFPSNFLQSLFTKFLPPKFFTIWYSLIHVYCLVCTRLQNCLISLQISYSG